MKKILITTISFILICFLIPIFFTKKFELKKENNNVGADSISAPQEQYNYKEYSTVNVLHTKTGEVETMPLDEYLYGVVASEMPANFEQEALKTQSIVARTYTIYTIINNKKHPEADICDSHTCCQAWISKEERFEKWAENEREANWQKIVNAVNSSQGKIITYEGQVINAFFHASSGGKTETVINVWGGDNYPYLQAIETSRRRRIYSI